MCVGMLFRSMCYWLPREAWLNLLMHGVRTVTNISFITSHRAKRLPGSSNGLTDTTMMAFTFAHWVHSISIFVVDMKQNYDVNIRWMTFALIRLQDFRFSRQMHGWWSFGSLRRVGWYFGCMPTFRRNILPKTSVCNVLALCKLVSVEIGVPVALKFGTDTRPEIMSRETALKHSLFPETRAFFSTYRWNGSTRIGEWPISRNTLAARTRGCSVRLAKRNELRLYKTAHNSKHCCIWHCVVVIFLLHASRHKISLTGLDEKYSLQRNIKFMTEQCRKLHDEVLLLSWYWSGD